MSLSLRLRNLLCLCLPLTAALGAAAADVYPVVAEGENAPEALVRITGVRQQGTGRYDVTAVQGPCRSGPAADARFTVLSAQTVETGALYFKVPHDRSASGFALRRATPEEVGMYQRCRWR